MFCWHAKSVRKNKEKHPFSNQVTREVLRVEIGAQSLVEILPVVKVKSD